MLFPGILIFILKKASIKNNINDIRKKIIAPSLRYSPKNENPS